MHIKYSIGLYIIVQLILNYEIIGSVCYANINTNTNTNINTNTNKNANADIDGK